MNRPVFVGDFISQVGWSHDEDEDDNEQIFRCGPFVCGSDAMEHEHPSRWAAAISLSGKIGCSPDTLVNWVKRADIEAGRAPGVPSEIAQRLKALERENRELR